MRKTTIEFNYDSDKIKALRLYLEQRGGSLEDELAKATEALYQKNVPNDVRKFFEMSEEAKTETKLKKQKPNISPSAVGADSEVE